MRLTTFKGAEMGFLNISIIWFLFMSTLVGRGNFHINRSFDIDKDGNVETFAINTRASSAIWVEFSNLGQSDTLWSFDLGNEKKLADIEIADLNKDGFKDIIIIPDLFASIGSNTWLYVFLGTIEGFSKQPIMYEKLPFETSTLRPSSLSLVPGGSPLLAVSFGAPIRYSMVFDIEIADEKIVLKNNKILSAPLIENGYGSVYVGGFSSDGENYLAMLSAEIKEVKVALFNVDQNFKHSHSSSIPIKKGKYLIGSDLQPYKSLVLDSNKEGLLVPFGSDDVFLLSFKNETLLLLNTKLSGKKAFPLKDEKLLYETFKIRIDFAVFDEEKAEKLRNEEEKLLPPASVISNEKETLNSLPYDYSQNLTSIPKDQKEIIQIDDIQIKNDYSSLSPTLSDFLASAKDKVKDKKTPLEKVSIPGMNSDMESVNWADEAGFTKLDLGEYVPLKIDSIKNDSSIPKIDNEITSFTKDAIDALSPKVLNKDTIVNNISGNEIDLYYVLAMTPSSGIRDRYVFDGEAPFGVAVNQIPSKGDPTHFQHGISANLANLNFGETFDFAYSLRDSRLDSITTLTMVHDMQTNVVFMSISPADDSLSQSYQPESFDPKLYEFPDYFFEGFPNSLGMDFTEKLIRFSFDGVKDSLYQGIYLSSTTPSVPSQSLAVFLDEGILQAIRGEVTVRENGSKKVTTEFDLIGSIEPSVMFSRLITEFFPEKLKIKLLQGGSLKEPLFGPKGKIPKIYREPRLPDAQPEQMEPEIPIKAKQSNVPEKNNSLIEAKNDTLIKIPQAQNDEENPRVLEVEKRVIDNKGLPVDTLKLEEGKKVFPEKNKISEPEKNQLESNIKKPFQDENKQ